MRKAAICGIAMLTGILGFAIGAKGESGLKLFVNGKQLDASVELIRDTSYVPLRLISEMLGAQVDWNESTQSISITGPFPSDEKEEYHDGNIKFYHVKTSQTEFGWEITADIANADDRTYKAINFTAVFLNAANKPIGRASGTVYNLAQGQTKSVQFVTTDDLSGYAAVEFQRDFSY